MRSCRPGPVEAGTSLPEGQPLPRMRTKTTLTMMVGDMMKTVGGMMGEMLGDLEEADR